MDDNPKALGRRVEPMAGKVYILGAGPGDAGLLTVKATRVLETADVVFYAEDVGAAILEAIRPAVERIAVRTASSVGRGVSGTKARRRLIECARRGGTAAYLVAGDPAMFGRASELALALTAAKVEFEIVPGVATPLAAAVRAGIPLAHGGVAGAFLVAYARRDAVGVVAAKEDNEADNEAEDEEERRLPPSDETDAEALSDARSLLGDRANEPLDSASPVFPAAAPASDPGDPSSASASIASPAKPASQVREVRVGRSVVVRRRKRVPDPETPVPLPDPSAGFRLRTTGLAELIEEDTPVCPPTKTVEMPLVRDRSKEAEEDAAEPPPLAYPEPDWETLARFRGTLILVTDSETLPGAVRALVRSGRAADDPAALVHRGASSEQQVATGPLSSLTRTAEVGRWNGECLLFVGEAVLLREELGWFEKRPLFGYRVALTDLPHRADDLAHVLQEEGVVVHRTPLLRIERIPEGARMLAEATAQLDRYAVLLFSSPLLVRLFWEILRAKGDDPRRLGGPRIVALNPPTAAELTRLGITPDVLVEELPKQGLAERLGLRKNDRVLLPRPALARDLLPMQLAEHGAKVDIVPLHDTIPDEVSIERLRGLVRHNALDFIVHGTGAGLDVFWDRMSTTERGNLLGKVAHGAVGGSAARELAAHGISPRFELPDLDPATLIAAIRAHRTNPEV